MYVCQKFGGESEGRQKFLEATSSVEGLEVLKLEIAAVAAVPTLFFLEDAKQRWIRKSLRVYASFIF